ncbi:MAG: nicotinic acid mononucleotide adenyltransferase [Robiginitalea sp.]|jgi:antitoxin component YwqK of YwqJK toxin-antitoxin module
MKWMSIFVFMLLPVLLVGQKEKDNRKVTLLEDQNLVEAVYYYEDGTVRQKGTYNLEGELHGDWVSYAANGDKLSMGSYVNGKKHGKWFFWNKDVLKEVDYTQNEIASVQEWKGGTKLALQR